MNDRIGDLNGRTCVVTGASSGIGREAARGLARLGGHVVLACRSRERGQAAVEDIATTVAGARLELALVDVAEQSSVRSFARDLLARHPRLHVLVNNAGTWCASRRTSVDGYELTWATNVLGYALVTDLLADALRAGAPSRVVNVASDLAYGLDLDDVGFERRRYSGLAAYAQSKQADRMLTWALARRMSGAGVTANAMHPGGVDTGIFRKGGGLLGFAAALMGKLTGRAPERGADTIVWLAASRELDGVTDAYWKDRTRRECPYRNPAHEDRLVAVCGRMTRA